MIPRTLEYAIKRALQTFPAVLVTGPRQSGKTTLLQERFSLSHNYVSLENPDVRARVLDDPAGFLRDNPPPVILDEIQYVPQLLHYIKSAIDSDRTAGQWVLSGSQNFVLMQGVTQSLSGRIAVLSLLPFSIAESMGSAIEDVSIDDLIASVFRAKEAKDKHKPDTHALMLDDWLLRGGYPEIRANRNVDRQLWCSSYIQTYLERDVRQIVNVGDLNTFSRFLRLCAGRTSQIVSLSELARDVGVSVPTIKKWLSVLEASYQIFLLPPYFNNFGKRVVKSPKLYFIDTAIATYLLGLHAKEPTLHGPFLGPLFETMVVAEWLKCFCHRGERPELYYWRSKTGLEVDLIVDRNGKLHPLEIKATSTLLPGHAEALEKWKKLAGDAATSGVIVADISQPLNLKGVRAIPWSSGLNDV